MILWYYVDNFDFSTFLAFYFSLCNPPFFSELSIPKISLSASTFLFLLFFSSSTMHSLLFYTVIRTLTPRHSPSPRTQSHTLSHSHTLLHHRSLSLPLSLSLSHTHTHTHILFISIVSPSLSLSTGVWSSLLKSCVRQHPAKKGPNY